MAATQNATYTATYAATSKGQGVDEVQSDQVQSTKFLRNGQIFILRGEKEYTLTGQEVKWNKVSHLRFIHTGGSMSRPCVLC